ncbi:hypothetical protein LIP_2750 [Limnochorda pilosa]|uniref:ABC transporter permease n=1 Tax=Limnochorda pilosa TaxID=1555112 RepID=A0A0K2SN91_LIMPI|nr:hypothetical protein LIP_2750 [Limnochorda pilosa]
MEMLSIRRSALSPFASLVLVVVGSLAIPVVLATGLVVSLLLARFGIVVSPTLIQWIIQVGAIAPYVGLILLLARTMSVGQIVSY